MKLTNLAPSRLTAVILASAAAASVAVAASGPPALQGHLVLRPLTPGDVAASSPSAGYVSRYNLPTTLEVSGGLSTVAIGTPVYLEADVNLNFALSNITSVTWALTSAPIGSTAALTASPLGSNVPVYDPSDRVLYAVAGPSARTLLRPDLVGQYTVTATIVTATSGTTNLTQTITAGTYMGASTCALCHSGGTQAPDKYQPWQTTAHAMIFSNGISGYLGHYSQSCLQCHTAGYDTTPSSTNDNGFYSEMLQTGWTFPSVQSPAAYAAMPAVLQDLGGIQCENCHGPGSQHAYSLGNTNLISKTVRAGACTQCHDAPTHHVKGTEWYTSRHALTTGPTSANCEGCHSGNGFIARMNGDIHWTNQTWASISCQACHEPHGQTIPADNPHLVRTMGPVTMPDGTVVTNAGEGALCLQCHQNRNGSALVQLTNYPLGKLTWFGGASFGAHDNPQGDMVEGVNAHTYGQNIPSSAHRNVVSNLCVGCHMQPADYGDPTYLQAGGHTFDMTYNVVTNGVTNTLGKVDVCAQCHGQIPSFNFAVQDYNGDGVIEGVQTEVQHLLDKLNTLLPNSTYQSSGNYIADGLVKTSISVKTNWPAKFLKAAYNWQFVKNDGSLGVHNAPFATGILKASIGDLTGDANQDGLPDAWQLQYFGSTTSASAAPNASPAGDGVPNWLKYSLGLDPTVKGIAMPDGYVWVNGTTLPGSAGTNSLRIYTAAEVAIDTVLGTSYQIQACSSLSGGWQNVGQPIQGTGSTLSYLTPTRKNVQQFFRVVHTP